MERQRSHLSSLSDQFIDNSFNPQTGEEFDAKGDTEDLEVDDENIEAWEFEDENDNSDDDDYGCCTNADESMAVTNQKLFTGVSGDSVTSEIDQFLELLFQLCITLSAEPFLNGQPSSTLLIYFSGILGFSADCQKFQLP